MVAVGADVGSVLAVGDVASVTDQTGRFDASTPIFPVVGSERMVDGPSPTRRELLAAGLGIGSIGVAGCLSGDCEPEPVLIDPDAWTHPKADARHTGAVKSEVTRPERERVVETGTAPHSPAADRTGVYKGTRRVPPPSGGG